MNTKYQTFSVTNGGERRTLRFRRSDDAAPVTVQQVLATDNITSAIEIFPVKVPWLIQRMGFREKPRNPSFGTKHNFDDVLETDYMGNAHFEFGELPASLKVFTLHLEDYDIFGYPKVKNCHGEKLCILARRSEQAASYLEYIQRIIQGGPESPNLEERCSIYEHTKKYTPESENVGDDPVRKRIYEHKVQRQRELMVTECAWWDLENDVMFTFGHRRALKIKGLIRVTRDMKRADGVKGW